MLKKTIGLFFTLFFLFSQTVLAHSSPSTNGHCAYQQMVTQLNLTADQQAKIKAIKADTKATLKANWQQMRALRTQIQQLVTSNPIDESQVDNLVNQKKELIGANMKARIMAKNKIYNLLTADQQVKFNKMMDQWKQKWEAKMKNHSCD